ncbi:tetratricopeptide repeat protein [Rhizorhabdus histidinilytica]|uniref:tetratricopeptide repeat protein n=1 Tax=Rhizorhabdus histidinilytica TaxID=439228 RepID=UPI001F22B92A|nr:tetratricopeptide repeat protein [Rhizorhabdus histidinilytica]
MKLPFVRRLRRMIVPAYGSVAATEHVARGDAARSRQDWAAAAEAYRAAVHDQPSLVAIWIQLGHAQKEQGALAAAAEAYGQAAKLDPTFAETHVFMAHIYKQLGRDDLAILHFLRALHGGEKAPHEGDELLRLLAARTHKDRGALIEQLRTMFEQLPPRAGEAPLLGQIRSVITEDMAPANQPAPSGTQPALVFDISDLISYYPTFPK